MDKSINNIIIIVLVSLLLLINIVGIFLQDKFAFALFIGNSIICIGLLVYLSLFIKYYIIRLKNKLNEISNTNENYNNEIKGYQSLLDDCLVSLRKITNTVGKMGYSGKQSKNKTEDNETLQIAEVNSDFKIENKDNKKVKSYKDYKNIYEKIISSIEFDKINGNSNNCPPHPTIIANEIKSIFYKIPYFNKMLNNSREKNENEIMTLIEKFDIVSDSNSAARRESEKNLDYINVIYKGKSFDEIANDSQKAFKKTMDIIRNLIHLNYEYRNKFSKINDWIQQIKDMLKNIQEISEQNQVIALNSSIEAARIGEAGKGFRVLVQEIQSLNHKTSNFTTGINEIMESFEKYNNEFISGWDEQIKNVVENIENRLKQEEKMMHKFIDSSRFTMNSLKELSQSTFKVEDSLNEVMSSLQTGDIVGQQIKHIMEFLTIIYDNILKNNDKLKFFDIDLTKKDNDFDYKIREELKEKITVYDERLILEQ